MVHAERMKPWATARLKVISKATGLASMSPACQCFCYETIIKGTPHHMRKLKARRNQNNSIQFYAKLIQCDCLFPVSTSHCKHLNDGLASMDSRGPYYYSCSILIFLYGLSFHFSLYFHAQFSFDPLI